MALSSLACTVAERPLADQDATASTSALQGVEAMLHASAASWNAGDLAGFVDDYSTDPDLAFVGASGVTRGIAAVRASYEAGYFSNGGPPDSLRFEELEVRSLGDRHALALGRYVLYRPTEGPDGESPADGSASEDPAAGETITSTGWFSLVLALEEGSWRILHDHSSELDAG